MTKVERRIRYLIGRYNSDREKFQAIADERKRTDLLDRTMKWTRAVKKDLGNNVPYAFDPEVITTALYRPFTRKALYYHAKLNEMQYLTARYFGADGKTRNASILFTDPTAQKPWMTIATNICPDMHCVGAASGATILPRTVIGEDTVDNVTDWALNRFHEHYEKGKGRRARPITKDAIFHYVYGVLHDPIYREKYAMNLKRELPRIPFYPNFWRWAEWGKALMALHIGYEAVEPWPLERIETPDEKTQKAGLAPKTLLKADKRAGNIQLDSETQLTGIPAEAWTYQLSNRSALEWVLDQHKEKTPKDPTIRERFNTYRFADHKEKVVDLLMRVTRVSVETMRIVEAMRGAAQSADSSS